MKQLKQRFGGCLPQLIMFDLDGTLLDSVPDLAAAVDIMLERLQRSPAGVERVRHWVGNGALVLVQRALANDYAYDGISEEQAAPALELFLQAYAEEHSRSRLYPGAQETLGALHEAGVRLALVTNKPARFLPGLLQQHGLKGMFGWVVGGDSLPHKKPEPEGLLWVMEQAGVLAADSLFVGDSKNDIQAARAAGVCCAALTHGYNHGRPIRLEQPDWVMDHLTQLLD